MSRRGPWRGGAALAETSRKSHDRSKPRLTTSAMIASLASEGQRTSPAPFGRALVEVAKTRPEIVGMTADLGKYTDLHIFAKEYPDRYYQMGMAEQNLMLAAAGLAHEGFVPFVTTYAVFASRRTYDFVSQGIAEEGLNVKVCCALPGLTTGYGPSHQATEDIAIFRGMPDLTIVDPCDALDIEQATHAIAAHEGPVYMRLLRGNVPLVRGGRRAEAVRVPRPPAAVAARASRSRRATEANRPGQPRTVGGAQAPAVSSFFVLPVFH